MEHSPPQPKECKNCYLVTDTHLILMHRWKLSAQNLSGLMKVKTLVEAENMRKQVS